MKKKRPPFHYARIEKSPRLQRVLRLLKKRGWFSTWDIIHETGTVCPSTSISELRRNGYAIETKQHDGVWFYRLDKVKKIW